MGENGIPVAAPEKANIRAGSEKEQMSFVDLWRHLMGNHWVSFYDSQDVMRETVERHGLMDFANLTDEALLRLIREETNRSVRAEAARQQLAWRGQGMKGAAQPDRLPQSDRSLAV